MPFDWHGGQIMRSTLVDEAYRNTQNVRRFMISHCGPDFAFDRSFMAWIRAGSGKTMGDVADEWHRRRGLVES
ncbi:DUF6434 domain-containing protein [Cupriavidus pauculus]|uniref:DUF6434 domain-containing protein n=1 Tax=Cupriavidus pauculus TaxID=82633 RepID=A0A2N5C6X5_9BURK|nr:DUF6434 domain-containing protein [Cupriavidus pauculus]PLP97972.1 hypothetical protein CYJ10_24660 [Cupriavidus pauculus]